MANFSPLIEWQIDWYIKLKYCFSHLIANNMSLTFSNPNAANLPTWPAYTLKREIQILDLNIATEYNLFPERTNFWLRALYADTVTMQTRLGSITGHKQRLSGGGTVYSFKGIPYAKPPLGSLRFKKPQPFGAWPTTLSATKFGPVCPQLLTTKQTNEDCLFLNIFVPYTMSASPSRSVMIWVHGGGYHFGEGDLDGEPFALFGNVILVSINYRLGALGFFTTGDSASPGNYGLWDQHLAFQWVHDNIADYGGDPNSVTIFGESAGGGSVSFQSLYPGNQGLFQRVISQSGVASVLRADQNEIVNVRNLLFHGLNCSSGSTEIAVNCMRNSPVDKIVQYGMLGRMATAPVIDGEFVLGKAEEMLEKKSSDVFRFFSSLDYMVGSLDGDGGVMLVGYLTPDNVKKYNINFTAGLSSDVLCQFLAPNLSTVFFPGKQGLPDKICQMYHNNASLADQGNYILDFMTDAFFTFPAIMTANMHSKAFPYTKATYAYLMTRVHPHQHIIFPEFTSAWYRRATHAIDVMYLFYYHSFAGEMQDDIHLAKTMISYWTNFAKFR